METVLIDGKEIKVSRVAKVIPIGKRHVYDFEVRNVHNYYANGINVHNCKFHAMLDHQGEKYGVEFYRNKDLYLTYGHKNINMYPAGPSKRGLRGRTRWLTGVDEIGWFPVDDEGDRERAGASEVYTALDRSLLTVRSGTRHLYEKGFSNFLPGMAINLSSPQSATDMIMTLVKDSEGSPSSMGMRLATWEINPYMPRNEPDIVKAYRTNAVAAERDYGANPPMNAMPFIDTTDAAIAKCFSSKNRVGIKLLKRIDDDGTEEGLKVISAETTFMTPIMPVWPSIMSIDAGYSNNSFAITVMHTEGKGRIVVDAALEIPPLDKSKLAYNSIYRRVIEPMVKTFNVKYLFADRWQSLALLHRASEELGIIALQYSVKYNDFVMARSYLQEMSITLPALELPVDMIRKVIEYRKEFLHSPMSHLFHQMMTVRDTANTVTKGEKFTDDIFRSLVLGVCRIKDQKIAEKMAEFTRLMGRMNGQIIGAVAATRGGGLQNVNLPRGIADPENSRAIVGISYSGTSSNPTSMTHNSQQGSQLVVRVSRGSLPRG